MFIDVETHTELVGLASAVGSADCRSSVANSSPPQPGHITFMEINHEIVSTAIPPRPPAAPPPQRAVMMSVTGESLYGT